VARGGGRMSICRSAACDVLYKAHCQAQSSDPGREPVRDSSRVFAAAATLAGVGGVDQGGEGAASEGARGSRIMPPPAGWGFALLSPRGNVPPPTPRIEIVHGLSRALSKQSSSRVQVLAITEF